MRSRPATWLAGLAFLLLPACAGPSGGGSGSAADEQAIRDLANQYSAAYSARDTVAMGALVTDDYEDVDPAGVHHQGRAAFMSAVAKEFAQMPMAMPMTATTDYVRWINSTTAVAGGTWKFASPMAGMPSQGSWMAVAVKQGSDWKVSNSLGSADLTPMMQQMQQMPDTTRKP